MDAQLNPLAQDKPDLKALKQAYDYTVIQVGHYLEQCRASFDDRRCYWPGKSNDLRKHGPDAFPWEGASDIEVPLIAEKINTYVSLCMAALRRSNIRAYPVEVGDTTQSKVISSFLKWMVNTYIEDFMRHMEANANWLFEKGIIVTYVGWHQETRTFIQDLDLDQIAQASPELAEIIVNGEDDDAIIALLREQYPALIEKRAKKALKDLRKKGVAQLPVAKKKIDAPLVKAVPADGDVLFPPYTLDPQQSPQIFYRVFLTSQELKQKVVNEGWNEEWVDYVIEHFRGKNNYSINQQYNWRTTNQFGQEYPHETDYIEVVYCYQRLIDPDDGSEGIYCTVFHPEWVGDQDGKQKYAKHELLNGLEDYPFVCTRLSEMSRRFYDVETFSDLLRGVQWATKVQRDSRNDRASLTVLPAQTGPNGRPPADVGPGRYIGERRKGEYGWMPAPPFDPTAVEIERTLIQQGDALIGLDEESPVSPLKKQYYVDKFLSHVRDVLRMAFKMFQLYGPDEVFFRVTGSADPMKYIKGNPDENFDIVVSFDTQNTDPETSEKKLAQMVNVAMLDKNGRFDWDRFIEIAAGFVDPMLADAVLQPQEASQEKIVKQVYEDLTMIAAGIERPARPNGAQIAMQVIMEYAQQPDIAQKLQEDEGWKERLQKYAEQYQFMLQQTQNAQIGRIGTQPASVGRMPSQGIQ